MKPVKKALSLLLTLAILLSVFPAIPQTASAEPEATVLDYVFNYTVFKNLTETDAKANLTTANHNYNNIDTEQSAQWGYEALYSAKGKGSYNVKWGYLLYTPYVGNEAVPPVASADQVDVAMILNIHVDEAGTYAPELSYTADAGGANLDIYIVEKDRTELKDGSSATAQYLKDIVSEATKTGTVDTSTGTSATLSELALESGDYRLILIANGHNGTYTQSGNTYYIKYNLKNLTLTKQPESGGGEPEPEPPVTGTGTITYDIASHCVSGSAATFDTLTYSKTNGFWRFVAAKEGVKSENGRVAWRNGNIVLANSRWATVQIYVPEAGTYKLSTVNGEYSGAKTLNVYVADADIKDPADAAGATLVGTVNCENASASADFPLVNEPSQIGNVTFAAPGYYNIGFQASGGYASFGSLILEKAGLDTAKYIMAPVVTLDKTELAVDGTAAAAAAAYLADGSQATGVTVTWSSSDETVATVDSTTGAVTAVAAGFATIYATAAYGEQTVRGSAVLEVTAADASGVTLVYDLSHTFSYGTDVTTVTYDMTNGFWKYDSMSADEGFTVLTSLKGNYDPGLKVANNAAGQWAALRIRIPKAGSYNLRMNHAEQNAGTAKGSIFVLPGSTADIASALSSATPVGYVDYYDAGSTVTVENDPVGTVAFAEAGEYLVVFRTEASDSGKYTQYPGKLVFDGGEGKALMRVAVSLANPLKAAASGLLSDGSEANLSGAAFAWSSSDETVATVNSSTGVITQLKDGTTTITAAVTLDGVTATASAELVIDGVQAPPEPNGKVFVFDPVSYLPSQTDLRELTYEKSGNTIRFHTQTSGWNPVTGNFRTAAAPYDAAVVFFASVGQWFAYELNVTEAGLYGATLDYAEREAGGKGSVYLLNADQMADVNNNLNDVTRIAELNCYRQTGVEHKTLTLEHITIPTAGKYYLVTRLEALGGPAAIDRYLCLGKLTLNGVNDLKSVELTADRTELNVVTSDTTAQLSVKGIRLDGAEIPSGKLTVSYTTLDEDLISVSKTGLVTAKAEGKAVITATVSDGSATVTETITVTVTDNSGVSGTTLDTPSRLYVRDTYSVVWNADMASGNAIEIPPSAITYSLVCQPEAAATVDENGVLKAVAAGTVTLTVKATFKGTLYEDSATVTLESDGGKTEPTYYTAEKRANAQANIQKYDWAKETAQAAIDKAEKYLPYVEYLYENLPGEGMPRTMRLGAVNDEDYAYCRYCGADIIAETGLDGYTAWKTDILNDPWKIQCPCCDRKFPSNDFGSFYQLGVDENGCFDRNRALLAHHKQFVCEMGEECNHTVDDIPKLTKKNGSEISVEDLSPLTGTFTSVREVANIESLTQAFIDFCGYGKGYLKNDLYPELIESNQDPSPRKNGQAINGLLWGVDDGYGYLPGRSYGNDVVERHNYASKYANDFWEAYYPVIQAFGDAYLYTGETKYGVAGAKLLDRIADFYPDMEIKPYFKWVVMSDGGSSFGKIRGQIDDSNRARAYALMCDMFFPVLDNEELIDFLSQKADTYGLENKKEDAGAIWQNWEDGILKEIYRASQNGQLKGNYGMQQQALAAAAIVLDREPETTEMIEWIFQTNTGDTKEDIRGGDLLSKLIDEVDRDGMGNEAAPNYNSVWINTLRIMSDILELYTGEGEFDIYEHPKFAQMFTSLIPVYLINSYTAQIGDTGTTAGLAVSGAIDNLKTGVRVYKETNPEIAKRIAQYLYSVNGETVDGLNYGIFHEDPESLQTDVSSLIDENPEPVSEMMTGYGFGVLRDGEKTDSKNTLRDFWMYFGRNSGHGHNDTLNLGIDAFGLNLAPELGYPEVTGTDPNRLQWVSAKASHNAVMVNKCDDDVEILNGTPLHFDDAGQVKVMDVDASNVNSATDIYRRTVVMVEVSDEVSYGVDFFRILGGDTHVYSFHALSENAVGAEGLELTAQVDGSGEYTGSLAGKDVPYGQDPNSPTAWEYDTVYPRGYTWVKNVRRDAAPDATYAVDFAITDYRNAVADNEDIHLRMTQLNDFTVDEVALGSGPVPVRGDNNQLPETLEYVYITRTGEDLDTLFTTVYEPYKGERYISSIEAVTVTVKSGTQGETDAVKAVKVTHTNGRIDYVVYATNNTVTYNVAGVFDFRGFVGVYSVDAAGKNIYSYVTDGDIIGTATGKAGAYTGTVSGFSRDLTFENYIDVNLPGAAVEDLAGRYVYVENNGQQNAVYAITKAQSLGGNKVRLYTGTVSLISGHRDNTNVYGGYVYNIAEGQSVTVPMSYTAEAGHMVAVVPAKHGTVTVSTYSVDADAADRNVTVTVTPDAGYELGVLTVTAGNVAVETTAAGEGKYTFTMPRGNVTVSATFEPAANITGATMTLGNSLSMTYWVKKDDLKTVEGYYAKIIRTKADGTEEITEIPVSDWISNDPVYSDYYGIDFKGIAAKEMADLITVQIFNAAGEAVTKKWEDGARAYAMRTLANSETTDALKKVIVDMLNYGAAAQEFFEYNEDDLANSLLTEEQQNFATKDVSMVNTRVLNDRFAGTSLKLEHNILLELYFTGISDPTDMYAVFSFTDHYGNEKTERIEGGNFEKSGSYYIVATTKLVIADAKQKVSCTVYNSDGSVYATAADDIQGYVKRQVDSGAQDEVYTSIMKFATSSNNYFQHS